MRYVGLILVLAGCNSGSITTDSGDSDTGGEDSVAESCTDLEIVGTVKAPVGATMPAGELSVDLVWIDMSVETLDAGPVRDHSPIGAVAAGGEADFALCVPTVPLSDDLYEPDVENPSFRAATYVLRVFEDDGSGGAESWGGASLPNVLVFADGDPPEAWADIGVGDGWNLLVFDFVNDSFTGSAFATGDRIDLETNLYPVPRPGLTGTVVPDLSDAGAPTAGAYNITSVIDETVPPPITSTVGSTVLSVSTGNANVTLNEFPVPSADHLHELDNFPFVEVGLFQILVWDDTNGSGTFEVGEPGLAASGAGVTPRTQAYLAALDWRATSFVLQGLQMGWTLSEEEGPIDWSTGVILDVGE